MVGLQWYPWSQHFRARGENPDEHIDDAMRRTAAAGYALWEGNLPAAEAEAARLRERLERHGLRARSLYAGLRLHAAGWEAAVEAALRRVAWCDGLDTLVVNPDPLSWQEERDKDDGALETQAGALAALGEALRGRGVRLAYHTHHMEMRQAAREFHHMLLAVDAAALGLCLDAHWIYRGSGNSRVALDDIVTLYGERIVSLHLRQSRGGVWSEMPGDGDIDYRRLAERLDSLGFDGPIIAEQAMEPGTPATMPYDAALRGGREWIREVFGR